MKTAQEILAIPVDEPERLFSGHIDAAKKQYLALASKWQDRTGTDPEKSSVMSHVNVLFDRAVDKIVSGTWARDGVLQVTDELGREYSMPYWRHHAFELGDAYVGMRLVAYSVRREDSDLVRRGTQLIERLTYPDALVKKEVSRYMPRIEEVLELKDRIVVVVQKDADLVLLKDLLKHQGGRLDPRHVAWIVSRLYNVASYFQLVGLTHNHIGPETYFVSPSQHTGALLGGWWYAAKHGENLRAAPQRTIDYAPSIKTRRADARADLDLIKATARELLGDVSGSRLLQDKTVPRAMSEWLLTTSTGDAFQEFRLWYDNVLPKSFGPHRFVKLEVTADDVYKGD